MRYLMIVILLIFIYQLQAQIGGETGYEFLNLTQSARSTALNGGVVAIKDEDVAFAYSNPALLNDKMHGEISVNQNFHFADISNGFFAYGFGIKDMHLFAGINYIGYGSFIRADEIGTQQGNFKANEIGLNLGVAKPINKRLSVGVNTRFVSSRLDGYNSTAIAFDIGGTYENPDTDFILGISIQHVGLTLSTYTDAKSTLPVNVQLGISKKLEHLPFRFSINLHHLNRWDLGDQEDVVSEVLFIGEETQERSALSKSVDNAFRHLIINGEFLLGKNENLKLRFGYNHQRRKELAVSSLRSLGGFSLGVGFKVKRFVLDYGLGYYHLAGANNHISIRTNLQTFRKKI